MIDAGHPGRSGAVVDPQEMSFAKAGSVVSRSIEGFGRVTRFNRKHFNCFK
jgi:hypothetical protein